MTCVYFADEGLICVRHYSNNSAMGCNCRANCAFVIHFECDISLSCRFISVNRKSGLSKVSSKGSDIACYLTVSSIASVQSYIGSYGA